VKDSTTIEAADRRLLSSLAQSLEEGARRSGGWIACRLGCTQCCLGPFEITQLDAWRLRRGLDRLAEADPVRAGRVTLRAKEYLGVAGDARDAAGLPEGMDDVPCPALDPETGGCDLYEARPVTCRAFGPVTRAGDGALAACELCYTGVFEAQMAACAVELDPEGIEVELLDQLETQGLRGMMIVAQALAVVR
jgi:Fe-S-cluster containining protein